MECLLSTSSIEIASLIGKPHNDLMKAIRKMEPAWEQEHLGKFSQMQIQESLPNGGYRLRPCYIIELIAEGENKGCYRKQIKLIGLIRTQSDRRTNGQIVI